MKLEERFQLNFVSCQLIFTVVSVSVGYVAAVRPCRLQRRIARPEEPLPVLFLDRLVLGREDRLIQVTSHVLVVVKLGEKRGELGHNGRVGRGDICALVRV